MTLTVNLPLQPYHHIENHLPAASPEAFRKYAWIKRFYYQIRQDITCIYEFNLRLLRACLFFLPQTAQQVLYGKAALTT